MFNKIAVPVDLAHTDKLEAALEIAAGEAKHYGASLTYIGVTTETPSAMAHNPKEFEEKLRAFADAQGAKHGLATDAVTVASHDPAVDTNDAILKAIDDSGAGLVVMATHVPGLADHFLASHGGTIATKSKASVFLVRSS